MHMLTAHAHACLQEHFVGLEEVGEEEAEREAEGEAEREAVATSVDQPSPQEQLDAYP